MQKFISIATILSVFLLLSCTSGIDRLFQNPDNERIAADGHSKAYVPVKRITSPPGNHWFGYYDKIQCDPTNRYVLGMRTDFEHRSPTPDDVIEIGMVDLFDDCKWIRLGESRAWGWQQGCQLQFIPGSADEVLWNDREGDQFVCRIMNIKSRMQRTIPCTIYALSPDGKWAITTDYRRINDMRPGYGYAGIPDPNVDVLAPDNAGIWKVDLQTGEAQLIVTLAQAVAVPFPLDEGFSEAKHWFNHLLVNPDGSRFVFLQRWKHPDREKNKMLYGGSGDSWRTRMMVASPDGSDLQIIIPYNIVSHFIWRDPSHVLSWVRTPENDFGFFLFEDSPTGNITRIGEKDVMSLDGHCTYLPDNEWILNDTYPSGANRFQSVYLYHVQTGKRIPLADLYSPAAYTGEWRCDTHPRSTPNGQFVIVDSPNWDGRQMYMLDIREIKR